MKILQVSTLDKAGGAEKIALSLHRSYLARGHEARLAVGSKRGSDPSVIELDNSPYEGVWARTMDRLEGSLAKKPGSRLAHAARIGAGIVGHPGRYRTYRQGKEIFNFPSTSRLLELPGGVPDVLHAHNLHTNYFDLTQLPRLSRTVPTFITMHDAWLLSGHCAHSFECQRWMTGCGECPDLTIYPAVRRDATAFNWKVKKEIFANSDLYIASPAAWLLMAVEVSMLRPAVRGTRLIPYGIDLDVFRPAEKRAARERLGLTLDRPVLLVTGHGIKANVWRNYELLRNTLQYLGSKGHQVEVIAIGDVGEPERFGDVVLTFVPHSHETPMSEYYRAADIYLHPARADTFPNAVLESLACGTPVIGTNVGGLPEQIRSLDLEALSADAERIGGATGVLVEPSVPDFARAIEVLLASESLLKGLGSNAAQDARLRFNQERMVADYLDWYAEVLNSTHDPSSTRLHDSTA